MSQCRQFLTDAGDIGVLLWADGFGSNTRMDHVLHTEQRLTDLEIKSSFTEDTLDRLNEVVVRQQQQIDRLVHELATLREQGIGAEAPVFRNLRDELPPHY